MRPTSPLEKELGVLLEEARREWEAGQDIHADPSLPVLGSLQPTPGEMKATLDNGLKHARKLLAWSRSLPAGLSNETVPLTPCASHHPNLQVVIELLTARLARASARYKPRRGRLAGSREVAQRAAVLLMAFAFERAPKTKPTQRREFVWACLDRLGIECPSPSDHAKEFADWFRPVERLVARQRASRIAAQEN